MAGEGGGQQRNQNADLPDGDRRRAGGVYELNGRGRHLYPGGAERLHADADLAVAPDDAPEFCRFDQRHDDAGGNAAEPGRQQRAYPGRIPGLQFFQRHPAWAGHSGDGRGLHAADPVCPER